MTIYRSESAWSALDQKWPKFGQKGPFLNFPQKMWKRNVFRLQRLGLVQKLANSNIRIAKNPFLGILGQNDQFWTVFGQNGRNGNFSQKSAWNIFLLLKALVNCKVSEKSNERFPRKSVAYEQTYVCTNREMWLLRFQRPVGRETKNLIFKHF